MLDDLLDVFQPLKPELFKIRLLGLCHLPVQPAKDEDEENERKNHQKTRLLTHICSTCPPAEQAGD
jgi:hypothetical protein